MVIADDRILKHFKIMQGNRMQRQLKQRLLIERSGRIALPMLMGNLRDEEKKVKLQDRYHKRKRQQ